MKKGQEMGRVEYLLEGKTIFSYPLLAAQEVERMTMKRGMAACGSFFGAPDRKTGSFKLFLRILVFCELWSVLVDTGRSLSL